VNGFIKTAVDRGAITYKTLAAGEEVIALAAFGVAAQEIRESLNCDLRTAALLLRGELARLHILAPLGQPP
jgi:hypothetical protein